MFESSLDLPPTPNYCFSKRRHKPFAYSVELPCCGTITCSTAGEGRCFGPVDKSCHAPQRAAESRGRSFWCVRGVGTCGRGVQALALGSSMNVPGCQSRDLGWAHFVVYQGGIFVLRSKTLREILITLSLDFQWIVTSKGKCDSVPENCFVLQLSSGSSWRSCYKEQFLSRPASTKPVC